MAAGNQQKHLEFTLAISKPFFSLLCKNLKFKLLYFQNNECYPAENKQADGNIYFLLYDEDKNTKFQAISCRSYSF